MTFNPERVDPTAIPGAVARALETASGEPLPESAGPMGSSGSDSSPIPVAELTADGVTIDGFVFPEPSAVGQTALAKLTQGLSTDDDFAIQDANRLAVGVAWICDMMNQERNGALLAYATGGDFDLDEAAVSLNATMGDSYTAYVAAAGAYVGWVAERFTRGTGNPDDKPAEDPNP